MALRTSLVIGGDASGAEAALNSVDQGLEANKAQAESMAKAFANADVAITRLGNAQALAKRETEATKAAFAAGEITLEQYNRELLETRSALSLVEAQHRQAMTVLRQNKQAMDGNTVSLGQARAGYQNFGRQIQDVAVMAKGGANIGTILSTQGGQIADAVAMMGGRFSGLATFLAGPWGAAVFLGASVLIDNLIPALFDTGDAAEDGTSKTYDFTEGLSVLELSARQTSDAMQQLAKDMRSAIAVQGDFLRQKALIAGQSVAEIQGRIDQNQAALNAERKKGQGLDGLIPFSGPSLVTITKLRDAIAADRKALEAAQEAASASEIAVSQSEVMESLDASTAAIGRYNRAVGELNKQREKSRDDPVGASVAGIFISEEQYKAEFKRLTSLKNAEVDAAREAKKSNRGGADKSAREAARLAELGEDTGKKIRNIRDQFSDLPSEVLRSNKAMAELDDIASDIQRKNLPKSLLGDLEEARRAVKDGLNRPFNEYLQKAREAEQIDRLIASGREDEAEALKVILSLQDKQKPLSEGQLDTVLEIVQAERARSLVLRDQQALLQANIDAVHDMRGALEQTVAGMFRGKFSLKAVIASIGNSYVQTASQRVVEAMFGDTLRALESQATAHGYVEKAGKEIADELTKASAAVTDLKTALQQATAEISGSDTSSAPASTGTSTPGSVEENKIVVTGQAPVDNMILAMVNRLTHDVWGIQMPKQITDLVNDTLHQLEISLPQVMQGALTGATASNLILGSGGSSLGGAIGGAMGQKLGEQFLSKGLSSISSSLGGLAGPIGSVVGGILGGALGGLFKKAKWGTSVITSQNEGDVSTSGNKAAYRTNSSGAAGSVQDIIAQIADQLSGDATGDYSVSIGQYKGKWRVSDTGRSGKLKKKYGDVTDFGKEGAEEAALYAALDAIGDGAIKGLSAEVEKALKSSSDINKAVQEALKVQEVELAIGGLGAELEKAFKDFERQAQERVRIATDYGFNVVEIEKRNAEDRLKLSEQLLEQQVGSLQRLIDEMTSGSLFEGSAVDQRQALLDQIAAVREAAAAGEDGAADKLAGLLEQLNSVSRDAYGTTGGFADDRALILDAARDTIAKANQRITDAQNGSDPALATTNATLDEIADQNSQSLAALGISNDLLAQIAGRMSIGGSNLQALRDVARTS